tara:strand:- start:42925 stop:43755 length:831 start_codon:yes stop_codon:yes gene_type:complete
MSELDGIPVPPPIDRPLVVHRLVLLGLFVSLIWKWSFLFVADQVYASLTVDDDFFPAFFRDHNVLRSAFLLTLIAICVSFFFTKYAVRWISGVVMLSALTILCLHQSSYNDATFTTAWWTSLWSLWFVSYVHVHGREADLRRPAFLSRVIISMILLGGAVGKWTGEYWSGEVLYQIYFVERDFWVFNWLRDHFPAETLREIAMWYSRNVIVVETVCGFGLWLLPPRWAATVAIVVLTSIAVFSNWLLFSVLMSLIGLASAGLFVRDRNPNAKHSND